MSSAKGYCASALMSLNVITSLTDPEIAHLTHVPPHSPVCLVAEFQMGQTSRLRRNLARTVAVSQAN